MWQESKTTEQCNKNNKLDTQATEKKLDNKLTNSCGVFVKIIAYQLLKKLPSFYGTQNVLHHIHNDTPFVCMLSQTNTVKVLICYLFKTILILYSYIFPGFPTLAPHEFSLFPIFSLCPSLLNYPD